MKVAQFDEIGLMGAKLKRILSCLMMVNVLELFMGSGPWAIVGFVWHLIGYLGAHKRHPRLLGTYVYSSIAFFCAVFFVVIVGMMTYPYSDSDAFSSSSSSSSMSSSASASEWAHPTAHHLSAAYRQLFQASTPVSPSSSSSSESSSSLPAPEDTAVVAIPVVFIGILLVFMFALAFLKIFSLHLAHKMRVAILAANATALPVAFDYPAVEYHANQNQMEEDAPLTTPVPAEMMNGAYPFMQPHFAPNAYPNMPGYPSVIPPPLMYGQQPVFYTFTPNFPNYPPQHNSAAQTQTDEKQ